MLRMKVVRETLGQYQVLSVSYLDPHPLTLHIIRFIFYILLQLWYSEAQLRQKPLSSVFTNVHRHIELQLELEWQILFNFERNWNLPASVTSGMGRRKLQKFASFTNVNIVHFLMLDTDIALKFSVMVNIFLPLFFMFYWYRFYLLDSLPALFL